MSRRVMSRAGNSALAGHLSSLPSSDSSASVGDAAPDGAAAALRPEQPPEFFQVHCWDRRSHGGRWGTAPWVT